MNTELRQRLEQMAPLTDREIVAGLVLNIEAFRADGEENARHIHALERRVRDLERLVIKTRVTPF